MSRYTHWVVLSVVIFTLNYGITHTQETPNVVESIIEGVLMQSNIPYTTGDDAHPRRILDVYTPENPTDDPAPVVLFVSGGGWTQGDKLWVQGVGLALALNDVIVVIPNHRLVPEVNYAGQVQDLAYVYRWIRENIATYGGNPDQIFVGGHSAGAHLSTLLALDSQYIEAVNEDMSAIKGIFPISGIMQITRGDERIFADDRNASPINHVSEASHPMLMLYAVEDGSLVKNSNQTMQMVLSDIGNTAQAIEIADRDHFNIMHQFGTANDETAYRVLAWIFERVLELDESDQPIPVPDTTD